MVRGASAAFCLALCACSLEQGGLAPDGGSRACPPGRVDANGDPDDGCECVLSSPSDETCNSADDDCDTRVDEQVSRICGFAVGDCTAGMQRCVSGGWGGCEGAVLPQPMDVCEGSHDEDCDRAVDESCPCTEAEMRTCGVAIGACEAGTQSCSGGVWGGCVGGSGPTDEECDAVDNDCDDLTDEGVTRSCGPAAVGICRPGTETCNDGAWGSCAGAVDAGMEICDAAMLDENCDGTSNEGCMCVDGTTEPCGTDTGECVAGTATCSGGVLGACAGSVGPSDELCDGSRLDENCDGTSNEGCACVEGEMRVCGTGMCLGTETCDRFGVFGGCTAGMGTAEICDGLDNDCSGVIDDGTGECGPPTGCGALRRGSSNYLFCMTTTRAWIESRDFCRSWGYHLVVVNDAGEQTFLQDSGGTVSAGEWWIGLSDVDSDGNYEDDEWVAGRSSYRNWSPGEPTHTNQCVFLANAASGGWDDKGCSGRRRHICEAP